jgi:hypothetical protein
MDLCSLHSHSVTKSLSYYVQDAKLAIGVPYFIAVAEHLHER